MKKCILFDLDNTILDFTANEKHSLPKNFAYYGEAFTEEISEIYHRINGNLWRRYEDKEITMEELLASRFRDTMAALGKTVDGVAWNETYIQFLSEGHFAMPGIEVIPKLAEKYRLYIASNGVHSTQENRLKLAGIYDCFEGVFTSGQMGVQKPNPLFFEKILEQVPNCDRSHTLMVGDNLKNDIQAAKAVGLQTCMITAYPGPFEGCDYVIESLWKLPELLDSIERKD